MEVLLDPSAVGTGALSLTFLCAFRHPRILKCLCEASSPQKPLLCSARGPWVCGEGSARSGMRLLCLGRHPLLPVKQLMNNLKLIKGELCV